MTTIAFDGRSLAADKLRTVGSMPMPCTKVFRVPPDVLAPFGAVMFGASGDSWDCAAFAAWMSGLEEDKPTLKNMAFIVVTGLGKCLFGDERLMVHDVTTPHFAIGSGADFAEGAMAAGKSAAEAVEIASKLDVNTGLGVDVLTL